MKDSWLNHNTDKLILLLLVTGLWASTLWAAMHIFHHDIDNMGAVAFVAFMTGSVSNLLGALVMIMTGRVNRADVPPTEQPKLPESPKS